MITIILREEKKFNPRKDIKEMPLSGVSAELLSLVSKHTYSIRVKIAIFRYQEVWWSRGRVPASGPPCPGSYLSPGPPHSVVGGAADCTFTTAQIN